MNISIAEIRNNLADALNRVAYGGERLILERRGKPVAALVSMEDLAVLEKTGDEADRKAVRAARKEKGRPVALATIRKRLGMK
jgi:prevent-host-death family protein